MRDQTIPAFAEHAVPDPDAKPIRRIALSTGGGDAPGLNAVIRAATYGALNRGWDVVGIRDGFHGLLTPDDFPDGGVIKLDRKAVRGIVPIGGTMLGTSNKGAPNAYPVQQPDGKWASVDRSAELVGMFHDLGVDALVSVGGDGTLAISARLAQEGLPIIAVPKTIDNDLDQTLATFGFDTAVNFATECIDRLFATAASHNRLMVVEVMGRYAGWIALHCGIAAGAHAILLPEVPYDLTKVAELIRQRDERRTKFAVVVVAEGARPIGGHVSVIGKAIGQAERLGGAGAIVAGGLEALTGKETRTVVLGHLLRGGSPTPFDRLLGLRFGAAAVRALDDGYRNVMVALQPPSITYVPIEAVTHRSRPVPLDSDTIATARDLGICFGD